LEFVLLAFEISDAQRGRLASAFTGLLADWLFHTFNRAIGGL
jgi:hypothetical protein